MGFFKDLYAGVNFHCDLYGIFIENLLHLGFHWDNFFYGTSLEYPKNILDETKEKLNYIRNQTTFIFETCMKEA